MGRFQAQELTHRDALCWDGDGQMSIGEKLGCLEWEKEGQVVRGKLEWVTTACGTAM